MYSVVLAGLVSATLLLQAAHAQTSDHLVSEQVWIRTTVPSIFGGDTPLKLEATIYKPQGNGPFPIAIINHGSTGPRAVPERDTFRPDFFARILAEHGFASIAPMRRGRGASEGLYVEPYDCELSASARGIENAIADLDAVVNYLKNVPFVDSTRILISGLSRGGLLSVVYAAQRPGRILGVANFVGGWMGTRCTNGINESSFQKAGALSKVPTLWLYAGNDTYYKEGTPAQYFSLYKVAGGVGIFHLYPSTFDKNGHALFFYPNVWRADFNQFMKDLGFPIKTSN